MPGLSVKHADAVRPNGILNISPQPLAFQISPAGSRGQSCRADPDSTSALSPAWSRLGGRLCLTPT